MKDGLAAVQVDRPLDVFLGEIEPARVVPMTPRRWTELGSSGSTARIWPVDLLGHHRAAGPMVFQRNSQGFGYGGHGGGLNQFSPASERSIYRSVRWMPYSQS